MTLVVLSLGSNIDREKNIQFAIARIGEAFGDLDISPIYESTSVGFDGPAFLNLVIGLRSELPVLEIRDQLRDIEGEAGRIRGRKSFDNRVLDIDILLYGDENLRPEHNIPRDEIDKYAFVLRPLADLYPNHVHPLSGVTYASQWNDFDLAGQEMHEVELPDNPAST